MPEEVQPQPHIHAEPGKPVVVETPTATVKIETPIPADSPKPGEDSIPGPKDTTMQPVDLNTLIGAQLAQVANAFTGELQLGFRRQADSTQQLSNIITAVAAGELLRADNGEALANLNAGFRTPISPADPALGGK